MVLYLANPCNEAARAAIAAGVLGYIDTPAQGNIRPPGVTWCADNGCYSDNFDEARWWNWLKSHAGDAADCLFATAPDVVGDAEASTSRSLPWLQKIRNLGYPAAFVAQDGADRHEPPWGQFDVLFIGGTTAFKLSATARQLVSEAKRRGLWAHCGRVNSLKRYRWCEAIGVDSADGTYLTYGPDINLPKLLGWLRDLDERPALFNLQEPA